MSLVTDPNAITTDVSVDDVIAAIEHVHAEQLGTANRKLAMALTAASALRAELARRNAQLNELVAVREAEAGSRLLNDGVVQTPVEGDPLVAQPEGIEPTQDGPEPDGSGQPDQG